MPQRSRKGHALVAQQLFFYERVMRQRHGGELLDRQHPLRFVYLSQVSAAW